MTAITYKGGGHFTRTYEVWRDTVTQDEAGQMIHTWAKLADVPGRAYVTSMDNTFAAAMQVGTITWTFATPADTDVQKSDQVRFDSRTLEVQAVSVTSRGDRIQALCKEIQL